MKADQIARAFCDAQARRPYKHNAAIVQAATPPGGDWSVVFCAGAATRSVMWRSTEVALINPQRSLGDMVEGEIAMAIRATPLLDAALRAIIVLAEDGSNTELIRELAISTIAYVEEPAPSRTSPVEDDEVPSPLPWWTDGRDDIRDVDGSDVSLAANAAFIVSAVNSHADLLEVLELMKESLALADRNCMHVHGEPWRTPECREIYDRCAAAVAKAEGKPS
jgi:hypothetical protein